MAAELAAAGGVSVFPGWEFFSAVAGADKSLLTLLPKCALFVEEPAMVRNQIDRWWNKVEQRHERSAMGSLITARRYLSAARGACRRARLAHGARPRSTGRGGRAR
jgi:hypothetical protein